MYSFHWSSVHDRLSIQSHCLADAKIKVAIKTPIALRLFPNLKSHIRALRPELIRRSHFEVCRYSGSVRIATYCVDPIETATIAVGFSCSGSQTSVRLQMTNIRVREDVKDIGRERPGRGLSEFRMMIRLQHSDS